MSWYSPVEFCYSLNMETYQTPEAEPSEAEKMEKSFKSYLDYFSLTEEDLQKSILDVGAGEGYFVQYLRKVIGNQQAFGVEYQARKVNSSKEGVIVGSGLSLPFADESFEIVTAKNYLPMFITDDQEREGSLRELLRVVKSGGRVMTDIAEPETEEDLNEELRGESELEQKKTIYWFNRLQEGVKKFEPFLQKIREEGSLIDEKEGPRGSRVIIIHKP